VHTVDDCGDSGLANQLRGRIAVAVADDVIVLPACTIVLTGAAGDNANLSGDLDIGVALTLVGAGPAQTIIDGNGIDRVIHVLPGGAAALVGLTIRNGLVVGDAGGGILADPGAVSLSLTDVAVIGNGSGDAGGGILSAARLSLSRVTVADNSAEAGGGIVTVSNPAILSDSVILGNRATAVGGGIATSNRMTLTGVVIAGNRAEGVGDAGGFLAAAGAEAFFRRVVLARNTAGDAGTVDCAIQGGSITSHGHNRIGMNCGIGTTVGDQTGVNPVLAGDLLVGAGAGGGPHVRVLDAASGAEVRGFFAYDAAFTGGVRVSACDLDTDGVPDIVTAAGAGGGPHVRAFSGVTGAQLPGAIGSFFAYDAAFTGGVFVGCWDVDRDGVPDVVTGPGAGGGPHVRAFSGRNGTEIVGLFSFVPAFTGGVFVGP
jgi:hypothetical protein